ncbi:MAG: hypothetical protein OEV40_01460 [Acidimicrobiia bacterium]|nr:hypothetical protein [Acidimicrobiia bacterium]
MASLIFEPVERSNRQLVLRYRFDQLRFSTSYWYDTVDLDELAEEYGDDFIRSIEFHILAFEANKAASLRPDAIDFGPYADLVTDSFWSLWETIFRNVWGVWRYENDLPDFRLERPGGTTGSGAVAPVSVTTGDVATLMLCGGGKDSLVSMRLLERGGVDYDAFVYSHSTYGRGQHQHDLIDGLLEHCRHQRLHRGWVIDDAVDSPAARLHPERGIARIIAAETVSSYWTALPVALQHGFTNVALGVTKSTDEHNLTWERNGEKINYLWGMSSLAEEMLHGYVRDHLVSNVAIFHVLRPIHDINVFTLLNQSLDAVPATHSCAQVKPWCCRCAKCLYVWMSYVAWLPQSVVAETFSVNLFDLPENRTILRKMLGLESYKPADCVGTVSEARLAFLLCRRKGIGGVIADDIDLTPFETEARRTIDHYATPSEPGTTFPADLAAAIQPQLAQSGADAHQRAERVLNE